MTLHVPPQTTRPVAPFHATRDRRLDAAADSTAAQQASRALRPAVSHGSLSASLIWAATSNAVYAACQGAILIVLARWGGPPLAGQYALALAISTPVLMLAHLQLRNLQTTDARGEFALADYLTLRLVATTIAVAAIAVVLAPLAQPWPAKLAILSVAVLKGIEGLIDIAHGQLQARERNDRIAVSLIVRGLATIALLVGVLTIAHDLTAAMLVLSAGWLAWLAVWDLPAARRHAATVSLAGDAPPAREASTANHASLAADAQLAGASPADGRLPSHRASLAADAPPADAPAADGRPPCHHASLAAMGRLWRLAWPLGAVSLLISLSSSVPNYVLAAWHGAETLGYYAALAYLLQTVTLLTMSTQQAAGPRLAAAFYADRRRFIRLLAQLAALVLAIGVVAVVVAWTAGEPLLALLFGRPFASYAEVLVWLMAAAAALSLRGLLRAALTVMRITRVQAVLAAVEATSALIWSLMLVPAYGVAGAAWAVLCTAATSLLLTTLVLGRQLARLTTAAVDDNTPLASAVAAPAIAAPVASAAAAPVASAAAGAVATGAHDAALPAPRSGWPLPSPRAAA